jgi:hypothetical protein
MLEGLRDLPHNPAVEEHRKVYEAILKRMDGIGSTIQFAREADSLIAKSHRLAAQILSLTDAEITAANIRSLVAESSGWFESHHFKWEEDGQLHHGSGLSFYIVVFFPAVRLALCAVCARNVDFDPGYGWMIERTRAFNLTKRIQLLSTDGAKAQCDLEVALTEMPDQECLLAALGHVHLIAGRLDDAQAALESALESKNCVGDERAGVLYNLACVHARLGNTTECQKSLTSSNQLRRLDPAHTGGDEDLESVRSSSWFQELLDR